MFEYFDSIRLHALSRVDQNTVEEVHVWFPPLNVSQTHHIGTFAKHPVVRIHKTVEG